EELLASSRRGLVDGLGHDLLAHPALAPQQNGRVGDGHLGDEVTDRIHLGAGTKPEQRIKHVPVFPLWVDRLPHLRWRLQENAGDVPLDYPPALSSDYKDFAKQFAVGEPPLCRNRKHSL